MTYEEYIADLKPCPFCGSKDLYSSDYNDYPLYDYYVFHATVDIIQCNVCKATIALFDVEGLSREKLVEKWNKRAKDGE